MRQVNGRLMVAAGVVLALAGVLGFSFAAPSATLGQETDVTPPGNEMVVAAADTTPLVGEDVLVTVTITDTDGDPVAGVDCTFSIGSQPGSDASVVAGPVTTDANGNASTAVSVGSTAGTIVVDADCDDGSSGSVGLVASGADDGQAEPPASLPDAGTGTGASTDGSARLLFISLLAALGVTLAGAGMVAGRFGPGARRA